jgi:hypothetical protein
MKALRGFTRFLLVAVFFACFPASAQVLMRIPQTAEPTISILKGKKTITFSDGTVLSILCWTDKNGFLVAENVADYRNLNRRECVPATDFRYRGKIWFMVYKGELLLEIIEMSRPENTQKIIWPDPV